MEVKAVLFDLDGVLIDSADAWFQVLNDALKDFKLGPLSRKNFEKRFGFPIERDLEDLFIGKTEKEVVKRYDKYFRKRKDLVKLFPNVAEILEDFRSRKLKIALISNSTRAIVNSIINNYKLRKYFDVVIAMEDVKHRKPAPDSVLKACRLLKVKPQNAIFIGDTIIDMTAGKRAGCVTVGDKIDGDYGIKKLKKILKIIK